MWYKKGTNSDNQVNIEGKYKKPQPWILKYAKVES